MSRLLHFKNQLPFATAREGSLFHLATLPHLSLRAALILTITFVFLDAETESLWTVSSHTHAGCVLKLPRERWKNLFILKSSVPEMICHSTPNGLSESHKSFYIRVNPHMHYYTTCWLYPHSIISFQALESTCPVGLPKHPECTWLRAAHNSFTAACRNTEVIVDWNDCSKLRVRPETWQNEMNSSLKLRCSGNSSVRRDTGAGWENKYQRRSLLSFCSGKKAKRRQSSDSGDNSIATELLELQRRPQSGTRIRNITTEDKAVLQNKLIADLFLQLCFCI